MRNRLKLNCAILILGLTGGAAFAIPPHPSQIEFKPLAFEPPNAADFRHVLSNGVVAYLAPSNEFPLINLSLSFRGGSSLDPDDKVGLAGAMATMMRRGGSAMKSAADLDEEFDFLAAQANTFSSDITSGASLNSLKSNFDSSLALFMDMVRNPRFQQDKFDVFKAEWIEKLKQRNDDADSIMSREWPMLLYGADHFEAAQPTQQGIQSMTIENLREMHKRIFHPAAGHLYIAATGDFEVADMIKRLESAMAGWSAGEVAPKPHAPTATFAPGVYHVEKDIPQGKVVLGMRSITRDDPDYFPLLIANNILGGGGFTSRITNRVRSDEGLAYGAGSGVSPGLYYPGEFTADFQSKNSTVALAIKIIIEEINRIRDEKVSEQELQIAKNSYIETFPRTFESKPSMLAVFVSDEMTSRPPNYWQTYRDNIRAVTIDDVQRVAKKHFRPEEMATMVVGKWDEIAKGDLDGRASMSEFFGGNVSHLPLRDPMTMQAME